MISSALLTARIMSVALFTEAIADSAAASAFQAESTYRPRHLRRGCAAKPRSRVFGKHRQMLECTRERCLPEFVPDPISPAAMPRLKLPYQLTCFGGRRIFQGE